jgi:hypothetical protein
MGDSLFDPQERAEERRELARLKQVARRLTVENPRKIARVQDPESRVTSR